MIKQLWEIREEVRNRRPLVVNLTNNVVTNFTANVLLAAGVSPIMSEGAAEAESLAQICDALVLNIGTLHTRQITYLLKAGEYANQFGKTVVFDPVGVGATPYRNMTAAQILKDIKLSLIRGNYGELGFLAGANDAVKGVDNATANTDLESLMHLADKTGAIVAATGPVDYVTDGEKTFSNGTGDPLLQLVTGTGCALSSLTGAFLAVTENQPIGTLAALAFYGAAAEKAAEKAKGPGSFAIKFIDALYNLTYKEFRKAAAEKIKIVETPEPPKIIGDTQEDPVDIQEN